MKRKQDSDDGEVMVPAKKCAQSPIFSDAERINSFHPSDTTGEGVEPSAIFDPEWKIVKTSETNSKTFQKTRTTYEVELQHVEHVEPTFEHFDRIFSSLLDRVVPQSEATDYMSITLTLY